MNLSMILALMLSATGLAMEEDVATTSCGNFYHTFPYARIASGPVPDAWSENFRSDPFLSIDLFRGAMWLGHSGRRMTVCAEEAAFYCFQSKVLAFAVPKSVADLDKSWRFSDQVFSVRGDRQIDILGSKVEVVVIHSESTEFLFSRDRGLIAVSGIIGEAKGEHVLVSSRNLGFPFFDCESAKERRPSTGWHGRSPFVPIDESPTFEE